MGVLKSILLIVYFIPFGIVCGQFRIVGLLNVDSDSKADKHQTTVYQTNAQGRGFSIDDGLKKFLIRPKDIIRVHVIGDLDEGDEMSNTDNIFMFQPVKISTEKPKKIQRTTTTTETTVANEMIAIKKMPTKSVNAVKMSETARQPAHVQQEHGKQQQQQNRYVWRPKASKFPLHKFNDAISNSVHQSSVPLKHYKPTKRNTYKSRCRCERITNCPRMQISVTRCQPNYFMCCF